MIGVIPWREFVPASEENALSKYIVSVFMERVYGHSAAEVFTLLILWTTVASVFALLLGYSRIPYAAARDGNFFRVFGRLHPTKNFPHVSLLVIGGICHRCCALPLDLVIEALVTTRILMQFIGQIVAVTLLRIAGTESGTAVPHLALSDAQRDRPGRLAIRLRDFRPGSDPLRRRRYPARPAVFRRLAPGRAP